MIAFEAGLDRRFDGFTYNLSLTAPVVHSKYDKVASFKNPTTFPGYPIQPPYPSPNGNTQWAGLTFQLPYNTVTQPIYNPVVFPGLQPGIWTQGTMLGGSNEHIQGVYVNPSKSRFEWWVDILDDKRWAFEKVFPLLERTEHFRSVTPFTTETYDSTDFQLYDGPSVLGSFPERRGKQGVLQVVQASPSEYSLNLSRILYLKFHDDLGFCKFKKTPIVSDERSKTFNSGVNICVTEAVETWLDTHRIRSSVVRGYLNDSVMARLNPTEPSPYGGYNYSGLYKGINCHDFILQTNTLIRRIVFKTKSGFPHGKDYWLQNYSVGQINPNAFVRPLKAIGVEYDLGGDLVFVKSKSVICTLGTLATPILLMNSGIGEASVLISLGIPVLFDQPNMGKYITNHIGSVIRWIGDINIWGGQILGKDNSNGYLPGPDSKVRRKFQYFSGYTPAGGANPSNIWSMNLYDLNIKSPSSIVPSGAPPTPGQLLPVTIKADYYTNPDDVFNLCWIVKRLGEAILTADPTAQFIQPGLNSNPIPYVNGFPFLSDAVLFPLLVEVVAAPQIGGFTQQAHYVGGCGMGPNPKFHCVDNEFLLRGTRNVSVCDASSTPTEIESQLVVFPVQSDGNTSRFVNTLTVIFEQQFKKSKECEKHD